MFIRGEQSASVENEAQKQERKWVIKGVKYQRLWKGSVGSQILSPGTSELYIGNWMT